MWRVLRSCTCTNDVKRFAAEYNVEPNLPVGLLPRGKDFATEDAE